jgi:hypothetical protein
VHIDPRTRILPITPRHALWIFLKLLDRLIELFHHFFLSDLSSALAFEYVMTRERPYLQHEKGRLSILHSSQIQEFAIRLITTLITDLHPLENGRIEHDAMHMLSAHDYTRFPFELGCLFVRAVFGLDTNIDFQVTNASLFPLPILEVIEFGSAFDQNLLVFFARFAWIQRLADMVDEQGIDTHDRSAP